MERKSQSPIVRSPVNLLALYHISAFLCSRDIPPSPHDNPDKSTRNSVEGGQNRTLMRTRAQ